MHGLISVVTVSCFFNYFVCCERLAVCCLASMAVHTEEVNGFPFPKDRSFIAQDEQKQDVHLGPRITPKVGKTI